MVYCVFVEKYSDYELDGYCLVDVFQSLEKALECCEGLKSRFMKINKDYVVSEDSTDDYILLQDFPESMGGCLREVKIVLTENIINRKGDIKYGKCGL